MNNWIAAGLTLLPIPVGLAAVIAGVALAVHNFESSGSAGALCLAAGFGGGALSLLVLVRFQHFLESRYLFSVACRAIQKRDNPIVLPGDAQTAFVDIIPRSNWGRTMLQSAADIGFWRVDLSERQFLFEGDCKRYRIPFEAVTECAVEEIRMAGDEWGTDLYFVTVLTVETDTIVKEIPVGMRQIKFRPLRMPQRQKLAEDFCGRLQQALAM